MGFNKLFDSPSVTVTQAPTPTSTVVRTPPPTVTETLEDDTQADYAQRASRRRGLLSTILSNRNRSNASGHDAAGGNTTLG